MWNVDMEKDGEDQLDSKSQQLWNESSQGKSLYHQHDKSTKTQMAWACSLTWCVIARRSRRQDDWEMYDREKETTVDEQHMRGIRNSEETSWRQMSVMCLSDGSHWPATTAAYQKEEERFACVLNGEMFCLKMGQMVFTFLHSAVWFTECVYCKLRR